MYVDIEKNKKLPVGTIVTLIHEQDGLGIGSRVKIINHDRYSANTSIIFISNPGEFGRGIKSWWINYEYFIYDSNNNEDLYFDYKIESKSNSIISKYDDINPFKESKITEPEFEDSYGYDDEDDCDEDYGECPCCGRYLDCDGYCEYCEHPESDWDYEKEYWKQDDDWDF